MRKQIPELDDIVERIKKYGDRARLHVIEAEYLNIKLISVNDLEFYKTLFKPRFIGKQISYDISEVLWIKQEYVAYAQNINDYINDNLYEYSIEEFINKFKLYYNNLFNIKSNKFPLMLITVRPKSETTFPKFYKLVNKAFSKKWITRYIYVYEQKGKEKENIGDGFHIHALVDIPKDKPFSDVYREFRNTFKSVCAPPWIA